MMGKRTNPACENIEEEGTRDEVIEGSIMNLIEAHLDQDNAKAAIEWLNKRIIAYKAAAGRHSRKAENYTPHPNALRGPSDEHRASSARIAREAAIAVKAMMKPSGKRKPSRKRKSAKKSTSKGQSSSNS